MEGLVEEQIITTEVIESTSNIDGSNTENDKGTPKTIRYIGGKELNVKVINEKIIGRPVSGKPWKKLSKT